MNLILPADGLLGRLLQQTNQAGTKHQPKESGDFKDFYKEAVSVDISTKAKEMNKSITSSKAESILLDMYRNNI